MSRKRRTKYHVRKRLFLNRKVELPAFIIGIVEDTSEVPNDEKEHWRWSEIELTMGDCFRRISFEFSMDTKHERANSLCKINRIAEVVNAVREAIEQEVNSMNSRAIIKNKKKQKIKNSFAEMQ